MLDRSSLPYLGVEEEENQVVEEFHFFQIRLDVEEVSVKNVLLHPQLGEERKATADYVSVELDEGQISFVDEEKLVRQLCSENG